MAAHRLRARRGSRLFRQWAARCLATLWFLTALQAADKPPPQPNPLPTPPTDTTAPVTDTPPAPTPPTPAFPAEQVKILLAGLDAMMVTGTHRKIDELIWEGLPAATRDAWREAMKHEFRQIAYKSYQTSLYDYRYIPRDAPRENPDLPAQLPPAANLWAVRVDIDYQYLPKSRLDGQAEPDDNRVEQATALFYLLETEEGVRIVGSDRNYFLQFGQALPRGVIGAWAVGLITGFLALVFWMTMASHCWAARPKLRLWRWITAAVPILGALAYFFWVYWRYPRRPLISMSLFDSLGQALIGAPERTVVVADNEPPVNGPPAPQPPKASNPRGAAVVMPAPTPPAEPPTAPPPAKTDTDAGGGPNRAPRE